MHANWAHIVKGAAALAAAMGIGRFAYTPILPLMTAQANLTPQLAGNLATANYVGYLAGALAGTASNRLTRSAMALRVSLVVLVATLAAMPFASNAFGWLGLRAVAGFTSAVVFVIAVNSMLDHLGDHSPHLPGWGFGGVGVGIALSAVLVLAQPGAGWQSAWWIAAVSAAVLSIFAWTMGGTRSVAADSIAAPQRIAEVFSENVIFQGLHPYSVGRHGVVEYYSAQPSGMTVTYRLLETRRPAHDLVLGYAKVDFAFPDRPTVDAYLGVLLERGEDGWRIGHYQVSRLGG